MGVVFARNPVSVYASLKNYDYELEGISGWNKNLERILRWMNDIDVSLVDKLKTLTPVQQFCLFYNRRMLPLVKLDLPIIRYEDFVSDPSGILEEIMASLGLEFEESMMSSHRLYEQNTKGHGGSDMSKEINSNSLYKYKEIITLEEFVEIKRVTADICELLGYELNWDRIEIKDYWQQNTG